METARDDAAAEDAPPTPAPAYCRRCGYSLRGLQSGKCPECGGAFDLADRRTFARRPPRSRLRWWAWRVSLLALLLALAAASVPGWYWWQWRTRCAAIAAVERLGGTVGIGRRERSGLARLLPDRWAFLHDDAYQVVLDGCPAGAVAELDLRPLASLGELALARSHVHDATLAQFRGCAALRTVILNDNPLDGSGFADLVGCRQLARVNVSRTLVGDAALAHLAALPSLDSLSIDETRVTDAGISHLASSTRLRYLELSGTAVTDAGLLQLRGLTALRYVAVQGSKVTEQGKRELQKALPNVRFDN